MPAAAPGKYTSELWLNGAVSVVSTAAMFDTSVPFGRALAGTVALTVLSSVYTVCRTWVKRHTGYDLVAEASVPQPAEGPSADPLPRPPARLTSPKSPPPTGSPATSATPGAATLQVTLRDKR